MGRSRLYLLAGQIGASLVSGVGHADLVTVGEVESLGLLSRLQSRNLDPRDNENKNDLS